ncbi:ABC transporter permease [Fervidibacillus halotolerans]|uniref:FtsX-like permease family protein n=1 Tax=Fervidibacillus halotolerans TaxID=2980027 RepID=A0A9E8RZ62_9BACI|nr:FtsX-like permease family protein [Fervidibacillus halotolerans]WAA12854.1 FtsX-like permease family protein [Fervidibacillus halotolerans]
MNIINKVTLQTMKGNKRRTLVTIIGVIISVAMITAVSTLGTSFMDLMKRQTITEEGNWHVLYKNVSQKQLEAIQKDDNTETVLLSRDIGYARLDGSENEDKPYLFVKEYDKEAFSHFSIDLIEGRLPEAPNEIVISEHIESNGGVLFDIGETVTIGVGDRVYEGSDEHYNGQLNQNNPYINDENETETLKNVMPKTYTIVGIMERPSWEPFWAPGYTVLSYLDKSTLTENEKVNASVVLRKVRQSIFSDTEQFAKKIGVSPDSLSYHTNLLRYYGVMKNDGIRTTLISLSSIIMAIIIIGSVSLIYNAFAISVSERSKYLGMLASIGATKKQKRNSVFFEGFVIGMISIPLGILFGLIGIGITFYFINSLIQGTLGVEESLKVVVTPWSILISIALSAVTIALSLYIPARRASKISAIDAIRLSQEIKLTKKAVKTSKLVRKIFGIEAEIALKNLKRNKRRYIATIFSFVISIVLFLSVTFFIDQLKKGMNFTNYGSDADILISFSGNQTDEKFVSSITSLDTVTEYNFIQTFTKYTRANVQLLPDYLKESISNNDSFEYIVRFYVMQDEKLVDFAKEIGIDSNLPFDDKRMGAILIDRMPYWDDEERRYVERPLIEANVGDRLDIYHDDVESGEKINLGSIEIISLTNKLPLGIQATGPGNLDIIISKETMKTLLHNLPLEKTPLNPRLYLKSSDPIKTEKNIEELEENGVHYDLYNYYYSKQHNNQLLLIFKVFTYGFIILITLISVANIINTLTTSIALRRREFAMLRSIGMTPKSFNKMIRYESMFYGMKALAYGLPISIAIMFLMHRTMIESFMFPFRLPWMNLGIVVGSVFFIVTLIMLYSSGKMKKDNIIDTLKQENI